MSTRTRKSYHTPRPVTAAGRTHSDILAALVYIRKLQELNKKDYRMGRTMEILQIQDRIKEIMDGIRNAPVPEGREKKTYRMDDHWGFEHVSHTYDAEGNKVRVGDTVTYLSGETFWTIEKLVLNNDGNEYMTIRRGTGYSKSMVHGEEIHKVTW